MKDQPLISLPRNLQPYPLNEFFVRHAIADHPLLKIESIVNLCRKLPPASIEYNAGDLSISQDPTKTPDNGLSATETIERISTCKSWLVLKNIEQDPEYADLLDSCLDSVNMLVKTKTGEMFRRAAFIFISSPNSVTPFHMDPEHNFLLQISGSKVMRMWKSWDRDVLPIEKIEKALTGTHGHRNLAYDESFAAKASAYKLHTGDGIYVPVHAPHWVKNGDSVSISLSITYRSTSSQKTARLHILNAYLRKFGIAPTFPGANLLNDNVKDFVCRALVKAKLIS